jgi:hypothetical protein
MDQVFVAQVKEPETLEEALKGEYAKEWKEAIQKEYNSLIKNETWEVVELPPNRKTIGCKWVFKVKYKADGTIDRFKAHLVAKGYTQKEGVDYTETFSFLVGVFNIKLASPSPSVSMLRSSPR